MFKMLLLTKDGIPESFLKDLAEGNCFTASGTGSMYNKCLPSFSDPLEFRANQDNVCIPNRTSVHRTIKCEYMVDVGMTLYNTCRFCILASDNTQLPRNEDILKQQTYNY